MIALLERTSLQKLGRREQFEIGKASYIGTSTEYEGYEILYTCLIMMLEPTSMGLKPLVPH
jgi:hypothetical protein